MGYICGKLQSKEINLCGSTRVLLLFGPESVIMCFVFLSVCTSLLPTEGVVPEKFIWFVVLSVGVNNDP